MKKYKMYMKSEQVYTVQAKEDIEAQFKAVQRSEEHGLVNDWVERFEVEDE